MQRGLRAAPRQRPWCRGVKAVFQHVEVERAQVFAAIDLQFGDDRVEFINLVVRQDVGLQLRCSRQRVAVDFQQLVKRHGVFGRVKVADVGHQKAQRVADAAVAIDHARQNFVVNAQVARVVGRGAPQADDFSAQLA